MIRNLLISISLFLVLVILGCNSIEQIIFGNDKNTEKKELVSINKSECLGSLHKTTGESVTAGTHTESSWYVKSITRESELTHILLHYHANCCADFADSLVIDNENVDLYLRYVGGMCLCVCDFEGDFVFNIGSMDWMHLKIYLKSVNGPDYHSMVDTTLVVP